MESVVHVSTSSILGIKVEQHFLKLSELCLKLEEDSVEENTKSAVYSVGIGLVLKSSKVRPAQWIAFVT